MSSLMKWSPRWRTGWRPVSALLNVSWVNVLMCSCRQVLNVWVNTSTVSKRFGSVSLLHTHTLQSFADKSQRSVSALLCDLFARCVFFHPRCCHACLYIDKWCLNPAAPHCSVIYIIFNSQQAAPREARRGKKRGHGVLSVCRNGPI